MKKEEILQLPFILFILMVILFFGSVYGYMAAILLTGLSFAFALLFTWLLGFFGTTENDYEKFFPVNLDMEYTNEHDFDGEMDADGKVTCQCDHCRERRGEKR